MKKLEWNWGSHPIRLGFTILFGGIVVTVTDTAFAIMGGKPLLGLAACSEFVLAYAGAICLVNVPGALQRCYEEAIFPGAAEGGCTQCCGRFVPIRDHDKFLDGIVVWHSPECVDGARVEMRMEERA